MIKIIFRNDMDGISSINNDDVILKKKFVSKIVEFEPNVIDNSNDQVNNVINENSFDKKKLIFSDITNVNNANDNKITNKHYGQCSSNNKYGIRNGSTDNRCRDNPPTKQINGYHNRIHVRIGFNKKKHKDEHQ